jgi:hypothetical protein
MKKPNDEPTWSWQLQLGVEKIQRKGEKGILKNFRPLKMKSKKSTSYSPEKEIAVEF